MRRALLFACALLALPFAQAADLQPFSASYTADWKQLPMSGTAERSLEKKGDGTWKLSFKASMMIASLTEESTLTLDKDTLLPQSYHFERGGLGKAKKADLDFDWNAKMVTGTDRGDAVKIPLNRGMVDKSTYQLALQHDVAAGKKSMSYQVVDDGEVDTYDFRVLGSEKSTPRPARSTRSRSSACATRHKANASPSCGSPRTGITCWFACNRSKPTARSTTSCS